MDCDFSRASQRGLTLLEMMVVLLIAALAIGISFQSLEQWRKANATISTIGITNQKSLLTESWLRDSLRNLIPTERKSFEGDPRHLRGITTQAVQAHQGGATPVQWSLRSNASAVELVVEENGMQLSLPLQGVQQADFQYLDDEGQWHATWPPALGKQPELPAVIALRQQTHDGRSRIWTYAILGMRDPRPTAFEMSADD